MALDGGPYFKFNPTVSFTIIRTSKEEVEKLFNALLEGGMALMPLQKYPFSEFYGWVQDKYGISWQIGMGENAQTITPSLMFVGEHFGHAEEAVRFYTTLFKNTSIKTLTHYGPHEHIEEGRVKYASFMLEGQPFVAMESVGHKFEASGAISFYVECETQEEVDYYWDALTKDGDPKAQQCGWLKDKFGVSWQIIPKTLGELMSDPDKTKAGRVTQAMLQMKKIDIEGLRKAYEGQ
jgi:predicted 3-demethylubiquinone-9 3-methyltransferase (glyoxalase superfamily)